MDKARKENKNGTSLDQNEVQIVEEMADKAVVLLFKWHHVSSMPTT